MRKDIAMGFDYQRRDDGIVVVTMDMDGQSANTMSGVYHALMGATVARLEGEPGLRGVVIASAKKTFFAGGDLHALLANRGADAAYRDWLVEDKGFLRRLEKLGVPVVAAINGAALGGGLEICLACHHRVILDESAALTGLPEVTLGLLPGAGGCARLPWLTGVAPALDLLLTGRTVAPAEALSLGLVDRIVPERADLLPAALAWIEAQDAPPVQPWDRPRAPRPEGEMIALRALLAESRARVQAQTRGLMPGPQKIIEIVEAGLVLDIDSVLALETRHFCALVGLPETRAAITLNFFAKHALRSGKLRPEGPRTRIEAVAITGDGPLAGGLAALAAKRGLGAGPDAVSLTCEGAEIRLTTVEGATVALCPQRLDPPGAVVEILRQAGTTEASLALAHDLVLRLGLLPLVVADRPGRFLGRLSAALEDETRLLLAEGAEPGALKALAAAGGLDLPLDAAPITDAGTDPDALPRLLCRMALEALACLAEGVVGHAAAADLASVEGAGFPRHLGGAACYARAEGFATLTGDLALRRGPRFQLTPGLCDWLRDTPPYTA